LTVDKRGRSQLCHKRRILVAPPIIKVSNEAAADFNCNGIVCVTASLETRDYHQVYPHQTVAKNSIRSVLH
jgi:hypothetical protein